MELEFWARNWAAGKTGFHQSQPNPYLVAHEAHLRAGAEKMGTVLVPLCGKSLDLHWLATRAEHVVGVEFVPQAVATFFEEWGRTPQRTETPCGPVFTLDNLTIIQGDFLDLQRSDLDALGIGPIDAAYDRAACVALPKHLRARYAAALARLLPAGAPALSVTFSYDERLYDGPPFSVTDERFAEIFGTDFDLAVLARAHSDNGPAGLPLENTARALTRRPTP